MRIYVEGKGRGTYVSFNRKNIGANEHTIAFDSGETEVIKLKNEMWALGKREMDVRDPISP